MKIVFDDGVCDDVDVEPIGDDCYRLLMTPLASETGARYGDVIELKEEGEVQRFVRIVESSPLVTIQRLVARDIAAGAALNDLLTDVRGVGGEWERAFGGIFLFHVPAGRVTWVEARLNALRPCDI